MIDVAAAPAATVRTSVARRGAFTLVEAIVVIVILGVLAAVIAPRLIGRIGQSKQAVAQSNAAALATAARSFLIDCSRIPDGAGIDILWERPSDVDQAAWKGPYVENADLLKDPWGRKYLLIVPGQKNVDFDVVSYGADGKPGGEGEDADIRKP
jgi:general secretion pathway protein G